MQIICEQLWDTFAVGHLDYGDVLQSAFFCVLGIFFCQTKWCHIPEDSNLVNEIMAYGDTICSVGMV